MCVFSRCLRLRYEFYVCLDQIIKMREKCYMNNKIYISHWRRLKLETCTLANQQINQKKYNKFTTSILIRKTNEERNGKKPSQEATETNENAALIVRLRAQCDEQQQKYYIKCKKHHWYM